MLENEALSQNIEEKEEIILVDETTPKEKVTLSGFKDKISSAFEGNTVKEKVLDAAEKTAKTVGVSAATIATEIVEGTAATFNITSVQEKLYQKRNAGWNKVRSIWGKEEKEHDRLDGAEIRKDIKNVTKAVVRNIMEKATQTAEQTQMYGDDETAQAKSYRHNYDEDLSLTELELDIAMLEIETELDMLDNE